MLRIEGPQTPTIIESELRRLITERDTMLQLPLRPRNWWLGGEQGLVELIITWARLVEKGVLATYIESDADPDKQLRIMARRIFGFVALMMADEIVDRDLNSSRSLKKYAYPQCKRVVEMMFEPVSQFALGSRVFLISVDHSTVARIPWLYAANGEVGDRFAFIALAKDLNERTTRNSGAIPLSANVLPKIGAILHELYKNTHTFARTDHHDVPWRRSVRGITAVRHIWDQEKLAAISHDVPPLHSYFSKLLARSQDGRLKFLELAVFDSGVGLARRWLNEKWSGEISLSDEFQACLDCLTKYKSSTRKDDRGMGLAEVMQTVASLDGFIKLRTGRLSVYRDFVSSPRSSDSDVQLSDFKTCQLPPSEFAPIYGTHYQILIPVF